GKANCQRMNDFPLGPQCLARACDQNLVDVGLVDLMATQINRGGRGLALQPAGRHIDDQRLHRQPCHPLGSIHSQPNSLLRLFQIDDHAGLYAFGLLVPDADDLDAMRPLRQCEATFIGKKPCNDAANFAGANIQHGNDTRAALRGTAVAKQPTHILAPFLRAAIILSNASLCDSAASGERATVMRSPSRRSTTVRSRSNNAYSTSRRATSAMAAATLCSGRRTVMPLPSRRSQRRSAIRI